MRRFHLPSSIFHLLLCALFLATCVLGPATSSHAAKMYWATGISGGGDALDGIDGTGLLAGDGCVALVDSAGSPLIYFYRLYESSAAESSPSVISPDANAGTKRWHLAAISQVNSVLTALGVASGATNFGSFTGSTFADNQTAKAILQAAETAIEGKVSSSSAADYTPPGTNIPLCRTGGSPETIGGCTNVTDAVYALKIVSGTSALGTGSISSGACATVVTTSATGTATTDVINWGFNGDPTGVTGYAPSANGMLTIIAYPSANNVNYKVCNNTAGAITPGAITLNWIVVR